MADKNIVRQDYKVGKQERKTSLNQKPTLLWFTGLSGSGKSTLADKLEQELHKRGFNTYLLDGDNVRHGLNKDIDFSEQGRTENIRRIGEVAKLMLDAGLIVLTAFISPFKKDRQLVRDLVEDGEFVEVFVDAPLDVCESRDVKGLYEKARSGKITNFTGISSPYEKPENPELIIDTDALSIEEATERILGKVLPMVSIDAK